MENGSDCRNQFRFDHDGIKRLAVLLQLPAALFTPHPHGDRLSAVEGVCLLLDRLSYPRLLLDWRLRYDQFPSALRQILIYIDASRSRGIKVSYPVFKDSNTISNDLRQRI